MPQIAGPIRWGVIGLGWFGEIHADTLAGMPGVELTAICTRRQGRLDELGTRFNVSRRYTDYRDLLADPEVDAVSITSHADEHCAMALAALAADKHVLLETPMATTVADCDRIVATARQSGGLLLVGHICRFDPRVALAKQAIEEGRVGRIVSIHARRNLSRAIGHEILDKISVLMGGGIHSADAILWFTQARPVSVFAQETHPGTRRNPGAAWAMVRLDNGAIGVIEAIWHLPETTPFHVDARMEVIGTEGALYIDCGEAGLEIHASDGVRLPDTICWPRVFGERFGVLRAELQYFADCIREGRPPHRITAEESRAVVELITAAQESSRTNKTVAF